MKVSSTVIHASLYSTAFCHIQLRHPFPFRSPLNPDCNKWPWPCGQPDWSNTNPLHDDGSNFPCKHYHRDSNPSEWRFTADYIAGEDYSITFDGTATHLGGSCQLSLSYDEGKTFRVIKSIEGGCPLTTGYNFTIPAIAATSQAAIFSWTWFNREGFREMYQNCVPVQIRRRSPGPGNTLQHLPLIYECNIGNNCRTLEYRRLCFPNPGPVLEVGNDQNPNGETIIGEVCPRGQKYTGGYPQAGMQNVQAVEQEGSKEAGEL